MLKARLKTLNKDRLYPPQHLQVTVFYHHYINVQYYDVAFVYIVLFCVVNWLTAQGEASGPSVCFCIYVF